MHAVGMQHWIESCVPKGTPLFRCSYFPAIEMAGYHYCAPLGRLQTFFCRNTRHSSSFASNQLIISPLTR